MTRQTHIFLWHPMYKGRRDWISPNRLWAMLSTDEIGDMWSFDTKLARLIRPAQ